MQLMLATIIRIAKNAMTTFRIIPNAVLNAPGSFVGATGWVYTGADAMACAACGAGIGLGAEVGAGIGADAGAGLGAGLGIETGAGIGAGLGVGLGAGLDA